MANSNPLPIDPEIYQKTLAQIRIQQVALDKVTADCKRGAINPADATVEVKASTRSEHEESEFHALITYSLTAIQNTHIVLSIEATFRLTFETDLPVPTGFSEVFETYNLRPSTMPYFRELVASITGRMEIATLTLPYELLGRASAED